MIFFIEWLTSVFGHETNESYNIYGLTINGLTRPSSYIAVNKYNHYISAFIYSQRLLFFLFVGFLFMQVK